MSAIKRWIEDFVDTLATAYKYDYDWLYDTFVYYCVENSYMTTAQFAESCRNHIFYDEVLAS